MSETRSTYNDEIVVGLLGLIVSTGFLKANEIFQFFDMLDLFYSDQSTLFVRASEFFAAVAFAGFYIVFLALAAFALATVGRTRGRSPRRSGISAVSSVIGVLAIVQFMSLAASFSHAMHRYNEAIASAKHVEWTLNTR